MALATAQSITDLGNPDTPGGAPTVDEARLLTTLENIRDHISALVGLVGTTSTTAALAAVGNAINTTGKTTGKVVLNTTDGALYRASGTAAAAPWNQVGGGTAITPV